MPPNEPLHITVVASAGDFRSVQVFMPGDEAQKHPYSAWECRWCGWICVSTTREELPPHTCLSNQDGVVRVHL